MDLWFSSKRNQAIPSRAQINYMYTMLYYYSAGSLGLAYDKLTETTSITSKASALHHPHHITVAVPLLLCHLSCSLWWTCGGDGEFSSLLSCFAF